LAAKVDELTFGSMVIVGSKYRRDALILVGGPVKKQRGGFLIFGSHKIKKRELQELSHGQPEVIVVGTGTDDVAHVAH